MDFDIPCRNCVVLAICKAVISREKTKHLPLNADYDFLIIANLVPKCSLVWDFIWKGTTIEESVSNRKSLEDFFFPPKES